jgi:hypothetical protein
MKSWKKYYQMISIAFIGLSAYLFITKYPSHSKSLFTHANGIIKYMPIDKEAGDLLSPLFSMASFGSNAFDNNNNANNNASERRILGSGGGISNGNIKRSVSETKKKYVAAQQGWTCGSCKKQLPAWFEVDHKTRLDQGGSNHVDNLVALCRDCHGKKTAFENL